MSALRWRSTGGFGMNWLMLKTLRVRGLSLLSDVRIDLGPGLNVLTGETGAGKSLLVSALGLLLGRTARARTSSSAAEAEVEAEFAVRGAAVLLARLSLSGSRVRASLDGRGVPLAELRGRVAEHVALTTQSSVRELASPRNVLALLDEKAGLGSELGAYRGLRARLLEQVAELSALRTELSQASSRGERTTALLDALAEAEPRAGEYAELGQRIELSSKRQQYIELCARVEQNLSQREPSIERELGQLLSATRRLSGHPTLLELTEELGQALDAVTAASRRAARLASDLENEPLALEPLERRRELLERLASRLGCSPDALTSATARLEAEREQLERAERRANELAELTQALRAELELSGERLHAAREHTVSRLTAELRRELRGLSLEHAELDLVLGRRRELGPDGPSSLSLGFSANPGEAAQPLERVASGGERSRFVLALACTGAAPGRCLVFDEVDQGVGGIALERMAERLTRLSLERQVVCITHQAAIAARAETHFRVEKSAAAGVTRTSVLRLDEADRLLELARMLAGGRAPDGAKALARRLLAEARPAA